jgi:hypothetical protein
LEVDVEREWKVFTGGVMDVLGALRDMETVSFVQRALLSSRANAVLSPTELDDEWLMTAGLDKSRHELRCHAAGPRSEPQAVRLTREQQTTLETLGWTPPDPSIEHGEQHSHWCAHRYQLEDARERKRAAHMLVDTLRRVHGFRSPSDVKMDGRFAGPAVAGAITAVEELLSLAHSRSA